MEIKSLVIRKLDSFLLFQLNEKEAIIQEFDQQVRDFEASLKEVVRENEQLHMRLEEAASQGPTSRSEWQQFLEQAKLVLEENQLLLEQMDVQQEKSKAAHQAHLQEGERKTKIDNLCCV